MIGVFLKNAQHTRGMIGLLRMLIFGLPILPFVFIVEGSLTIFQAVALMTLLLVPVGVLLYSDFLERKVIQTWAQRKGYRVTSIRRSVEPGAFWVMLEEDRLVGIGSVRILGPEEVESSLVWNESVS